MLAMSIPAPVIGSFITAAAALGVAAYSTYRSWRLRRDELTVSLCARFFNKEMFIVRAESWKAAKKWMDGKDPQLLDHFVVPEKPFAGPSSPSSPEAENRLDSASNISALLHFFAELAVYSELGLINKVAIKKFFGDIYEWWAPFMRAFALAYRAQVAASNGHPVVPSWVESVPILEVMFQPQTKS